jgi:hypothetical protein
MRTIVHRTKEIKNTPEGIRAPVKNWNTGLSFPVSVTDHINTVNVNLQRGRVLFNIGNLSKETASTFRTDTQWKYTYIASIFETLRRILG